LEKLKALTADELAEKSKGYLTKDEVTGIMAPATRSSPRFKLLSAKKAKRNPLLARPRASSPT
jgi:hypothetical protein